MKLKRWSELTEKQKHGCVRGLIRGLVWPALSDMARAAGGPEHQLEVYETFIAEVTSAVERFRIDVEEQREDTDDGPEVLFEVS